MDAEVKDFMDRCKGMTFSDEDWYKALLDFKISCLIKYQNKYTIFFSAIKERIRQVKAERVRKEFQEEIIPWLNKVASNNKKQIKRRQYNKTRREKNARRKTENSGVLPTK